MKKMRYNALNIKTVAKQVWFYFIRGTTRPGYAGIITKNPYLNQATRKNTCQNFPTQKTAEIENFKPKKIHRSSLSLETRSHSPGTSLIPQATWKIVVSQSFKTLLQYLQICRQDTYRLTFCNFSACFRSHCCCLSCFSFTTWPPHPQT